MTSARQLRATLAAGDAIHREWNTVVAGIARSRSARAGRDAAFHASEQARERYRTGTITQLDLLQVQRDAFNAEVSRIQADADLINARLQLRLSAGRNPLAAKSSHWHDVNVWKRQCKMGAAAGDPSPAAAPIITRYI